MVSGAPKEHQTQASVPPTAEPAGRSASTRHARGVGLGSIDPDIAADRRRKQARHLRDIVPGRLEPLDPADAAILRAVFERGVAVASLIATTRGQDEMRFQSKARSMRRRVRRLVARVLSPSYLFVMRNEQQIPPPLRRVARLSVLQGRTQREVADELRLSLFETRRRIIAMRALIDAAIRAEESHEGGAACGA